MEKKETLKLLRADLEKIFSYAEKCSVPHYMIVFHVGDIETGICGKSLAACTPKSEMQHAVEEIQKEARDHLILQTMISNSANNNSEAN